MARNENNANYVVTGKPKIKGGAFSAELGTVLPTDAKSELAEGFVNLGYISEDGMTNSNSETTKDVKSWGAIIVNTSVTETTDTNKLTFIESVNPDVLKEVYGHANVTGTTLKEGLKIAVTGGTRTYRSYVFDMITGNYLRRIVYPEAIITSVGDISYKDEDSVAYECTIKARADSDGNTHYEYICEKGE